ncbi:hypothetical protein BJX70DRAFT_248460 [Aspergillus crustosus]
MWQPFPKFYIFRPDGKQVPLIPLDELPSWLQVGFMDWNYPNLYMFMCPATISPVPREGEYDVICQYCISGVDNTLHRSASESGQDATITSSVQAQNVPKDIDIDIAALIPKTVNNHSLPDFSYFLKDGKVCPKSFPVLQQPPFYSNLQRPIVGMCVVRCARFIYGLMPTIFSQRAQVNGVPPDPDEENSSGANSGTTNPHTDSAGAGQSSPRTQPPDDPLTQLSDETPLLNRDLQFEPTLQDTSIPQPGPIPPKPHSAPVSLDRQGQKLLGLSPPEGGTDSTYDAPGEGSTGGVDHNDDAGSRSSRHSLDPFFRQIPETLDTEVPEHLREEVQRLLLESLNESMQKGRPYPTGVSSSSDEPVSSSSSQRNRGRPRNRFDSPDSLEGESDKMDASQHGLDKSAKEQDSDEEDAQDPGQKKSKDSKDGTDPKDPKDPPGAPDAQGRGPHGFGHAHDPKDPPTQQSRRDSRGQFSQQNSESSRGAPGSQANDNESNLRDVPATSKGNARRGQNVWRSDSSKISQVRDQSASDTRPKRVFTLPDRTRQDAAVKRSASTASMGNQTRGRESLSQSAEDSRSVRSALVREALRMSRPNQPAKSVRFDLPLEIDGPKTEPKVERQQKGRTLGVKRGGDRTTGIKCKNLLL